MRELRNVMCHRRFARGDKRFAIFDRQFAIRALPLWLALVFLITSCEVAGFVGQAQAQAIAIDKCDWFRLTRLQEPRVLAAEWLTPTQAEERGFALARRPPVSMLWLVTLQGRWQLEGGPLPAADAPPLPKPIFQRCIAVLDATTGEILAVRTEP